MLRCDEVSILRRYGRKPTTLIATASMGVFAAISAWVNNIWVLIVIRLVMGVGDSMSYLGLAFLGECICIMPELSRTRRG